MFTPVYPSILNFDGTIGVMKNPGVHSRLIAMEFDRQNALYIITKLIHPSQQLLKTENDGVIFSIRVTWNFVLKREIPDFDEQVKVLVPWRLQKRIFARVAHMATHYAKRNSE